MKAAIYARKSKDTQKGESTAHQIARCTSLCNMKEWEYEVYEDYGISGKDTDRPDFQRMMNDISVGKIHTVVCYKLDRVSRSVNDFSSLVQELTDMSVGFISLKENFDTSTPMGRAMMMITSVFAQLERETIAERVRDNMIDRAKSGKWNGGPVPVGYKAIKTQYQVGDKVINGSALVIDDEGEKTVKKIFDTFLTIKSIRATVNYLQNNNYTYDGHTFNQNNVKRALDNPIYCIADERAYDFFYNRGMRMASEREKFDGKHGIICYNRRKPKKKTTTERPIDEWIIAVGEHQGIIDSTTYISAYNAMLENKPKYPRAGTGISTPLTGLIRCGECGNIMYASPNKKNSKDEDYAYVYFKCYKKIRTASANCINKNVRADFLEAEIFKNITNIFNDDEVINNALQEYRQELEETLVGSDEQITTLRKNIARIDKEMSNLVDALGSGILPAEVIKNKYQVLIDEKSDLEKELNDLLLIKDGFNAENINLDIIKATIKRLSETNGTDILNMDFEDRKTLYNAIINKVELFHDNTAKVYYNLCFNGEPTTVQAQNTKNVSFTSTITLAEDYSDLPETTYAERLYKYLKVNSIYAKYFALEVGVSENTIHNILKGYTSASALTMRKISQVYPAIQ